MTPFKLEELERHLAEWLWLEGEEWQLAGAVKQLAEMERHLWIAQVDAEGQLEVEVQISPSKVKSYSCECRTFREKGNCGHIVAVLIELRALLNHRKREQEAKKAMLAAQAAERRNKLTLDTVLAEVPTIELLAFIREYARHHRDFSLALKARFMPQIDHIQSREKYAQLLQTAISVSRKADRRISLRGVQKLAKILEEILFQAEGFMYAKHYTEVMDATGVLLERITPILNKVDRGRDKLEAYLRQAFGLLTKLAISDAPQSLKNKLWVYALAESGKLFYRNQGFDVNFFQLLDKLAIDQSKKNELLPLLDEHLELRVTQARAEEELLLIKLKLLETKKDAHLVEQFFQENIRQQRLLKRAVVRARIQKDWKAATRWINTALQQDLNREERQDWQKLALEIAMEAGNDQAILPLAMDLFVDSGQANYFDLALAQGGDSSKISDEALQRLVLQPPRPMRQEAIATVLSKANRLPELYDFLEQSESLLLLQKFDKHWQKKNKERVYPLYRKMLMTYLKNHIGRVTSQRIKGTIDYLIKTGRAQMADRLVSEMKATYPERHSLMEELNLT